MSNILLEMKKLKELNCGLGQVCLNLGREIAKLSKNNDIDPIYFVPKNRKNIFGAKYLYKKSLKIYKHFPFLSPKTDLWHAIHQDSPFYPKNNKTPFILTIHDLNFLHESKDPEFIQKAKSSLQKKINRANSITTISNFTKKEIIENFNLKNKKIEVIYNGVSHYDAPIKNKPKFISDNQKFIFAIGTVLPKKNFIVLIDLLSKLKNYKLIIAGPKFGNYPDKISLKAEELGVSHKLLMPGEVSEEDKAWLYQNCSAFMFPSIAEGFGIPPIEAMRIGKPVFLSTKTSLPEVGGDEAYYFESFDTNHMLKVFSDGMNDYNLDKEKSKKIEEWASQFCWKKTAEKYMNLYKKILKA